MAANTAAVRTRRRSRRFDAGMAIAIAVTVFAGSAGPQPGYAIKRVIDKQEPATLVANDGSICRTSQDRYTRTKIGRWIACDWAPAGQDSTEPSSG